MASTVNSITLNAEHIDVFVSKATLCHFPIHLGNSYTNPGCTQPLRSWNPLSCIIILLIIIPITSKLALPANCCVPELPGVKDEGNGEKETERRRTEADETPGRARNEA